MRGKKLSLLAGFIRININKIDLKVNVIFGGWGGMGIKGIVVVVVLNPKLVMQMKWWTKLVDGQSERKYTCMWSVPNMMTTSSI